MYRKCAQLFSSAGNIVNQTRLVTWSKYC